MSNELLDDYTKADFPLDLPWHYGRVRLLAAFGDNVVGAVLYVSADSDGNEVLSLSQVLSWTGDGKFSNGEYSYMDLIPPPALTSNRVAELRDEMVRCQDRLNDMRGASAEWRSVDERRIASITREIAKLTGGM